MGSRNQAGNTIRLRPLRASGICHDQAVAPLGRSPSGALTGTGIETKLRCAPLLPSNGV
jgi:hypothetical protein